MKNFLFGLIVGLVVAGGASFLMISKIQRKSHQQGFETGTSEGISKGIIQGKSEQTRYDDSVRIVIQEKALSNSVAPALPPRKKENYDINYTMHGNDIGEEKK